MRILSLAGEWLFKQSDLQEYKKAVVPGCNYTDLLNLNEIPDPFYNDNEKQLQWLSEKDWEYKKIFTADKEMLSQDKTELVAKQLDTIGSVWINGEKAGSFDNIHREWVFDIKPFIKEGENEIKFIFESVLPHIKKRQKLVSLPSNINGTPGSPHIRKAACHFGWDFGPTFITSGITRDIFIRSYSDARIDGIRVKQKHENGVVTVDVLTDIISLNDKKKQCRVTLTSPDGEKMQCESVVENSASKVVFTVEKPQLWWCSGLGEQPLYDVQVELVCDDEVCDEKKTRIGLRTIELDMSRDSIGRNFCFKVNGVEIFARGANWIPADSFNTRVTKDRLEYFIGAMKNANMNMVRVWGGGFYESDEFYNICDEKGILVWQDFAFACAAYPFMMQDFRESVLEEVKYNVCRLRNHASLALWCGNNEIEAMSLVWIYRFDLIKQAGEFFYKTLREQVKKFDDDTPFVSGTPSSGEYMKRVSSDDYGDTHLWNVWHGMRDVGYYSKRNTRFCSEFGLESYPSMNCIDAVIPKEEQYLGSKALNAHQKCGDGDTKMLYYVNKRFWQPLDFAGLVYFTQLTQLECIRIATEHWRRQRERCHGAMYWQMNDIWAGTSWAGMDYFGTYKALLYGARHFNENISVNILKEGKNLSLYGLNDTLSDFEGRITWRVETFDGKILANGAADCAFASMSSNLIKKIDFSSTVAGDLAKHSVFVVELKDKDGNVVSKRTELFVRERQMDIVKANLKADVQLSDGVATITVSSDKYARFVCVNIAENYNPFSDKYFDITAGKSVIVTINVDKNWTVEDVKSRLTVFSICDIAPKMSRRADKMKEIGIALKPINVANWFSRLFE